MPFDIELEPGEEMIFSDALPDPKKGQVPFVFAVSSRAVFVPRRKFFAISDPWYFQRVPVSQVAAVRIASHKPAWLWLVALLLVGCGLGGLFLVWRSDDLKSHAQLAGYSVAFLVIGAVIPWVMRSRIRLTVEMTDGRFTWTPKLTVGGNYREESRRFLIDIGRACDQTGVPVQFPEEAG